MEKKWKINKIILSFKEIKNKYEPSKIMWYFICDTILKYKSLKVALLHNNKQITIIHYSIHYAISMFVMIYYMIAS